MRAKDTPQSGAVPGYEQVATQSLYFDVKNPRLAGYLDEAEPSQDALLKVLWQEMAVDELAMSIAASGFFDFEPLFAVEEDGRLVVIEGNRRLAAVKLLVDETKRRELKATDLPTVSATAAKQLGRLPVIRLSSRKDVWQFLGFKHVNGPAKWDSYSKAEYISHVHKDFGVDLSDIAAQIGDKHRTVQRLYRALMVVEQAERAGVFDRDNRYRGHFSFSHLYTGLDYEGIASFVSLQDVDAESRSPVPKKSLGQLGELCRWLYGDKSLDKPPCVQTQNPHLRQLDEVLKSEKAVASLRAGMSLESALEVSYGDDRIFHNSLIAAKEALQKARGTLSTGFDGEKNLLRLGDEIAEIACDLADEMERKATPRRNRRSKGGHAGG